MAVKSDWTNNTYITPAFCQGYFGTDSTTGHVHDNADDSTSAPYVNINYHTTGDLLINRLADYTSGTFQATISTTYVGTAITKDWEFEKLGSRVTILIDEMTGAGTGANTSLEVTPVTTWPTAIIPDSTQYVSIIGSRAESGSTDLAIGALLIPTSASSNIVGYITDTASTKLYADQWGSSASYNKGLPRQSITYYVD